MKILHVYKTYYPETLGGMEQTILSLSRALSKKGIQSDVVTTTSKNKPYEYDAEYNRVFFYPRTIDRFSCPISFPLLKDFARLAKQYDILHYSFPWPFADLLNIFTSVKKPSVLSYQSDIIKQKTLNIFYQPLMRQFFKKVDRIVTTSDNLFRTSPALTQFKQKTSIIPNGIEIMPPPKNKNELLIKWQEKFPQPFFLFLGVLRYYKGLDFLLEAARNTDVTIVIAGTGPEGSHLHELANKYQLKNVKFIGKITDADKWVLFELCHAVISASHLRSEAYGMILLEGLTHEKPLISTELGTGTSFINTHDVTGIVVPPENPLALKNAMLKLLNDQPYYAKLKNATLPHYKQFFTAEHMAEKYLQLYQSLL